MSERVHEDDGRRPGRAANSRLELFSGALGHVWDIQLGGHFGETKIIGPERNTVDRGCRQNVKIQEACSSAEELVYFEKEQNFTVRCRTDLRQATKEHQVRSTIGERPASQFSDNAGMNGGFFS